MNRFKKLAAVLVVCVALAGCGASQRYGIGNKKGYKDSVKFQEGGQVKQGLVVGYLDGWRQAYEPEDIEARRKVKEEIELAHQEALAEAEARRIEAEAAKIEERKVIEEKLGTK